MSDLIAIAYPDEQRAKEVICALQHMRNEYLLELDDAVYVAKDSSGKVELHQTLMHASLSADAEARLQTALAAGRS